MPPTMFYPKIIDQLLQRNASSRQFVCLQQDANKHDDII